MDELTTAEVAAHLDVSERRVLQYIQEKRLAARKRAGAWFVDRVSLEEFQPQPVGRPGSPHKDAVLDRYIGGEPVSDIAADLGITEDAVYKLASRHCRYRKLERRAAYLTALALVGGLDDVWQPDVHLGVARQLDTNLPHEARKQIAAKAVRVVRGQKGKGERQ